MRNLAYVAAGIVALASHPAKAAFEISLNGVYAAGTVTSYYNCAPLICPDTVQPFETLVNGKLSPQIDSLNGSFTLFGQDRARSSYSVTLSLLDGGLISSDLNGFISGPPLSNPLQETTFRSSNFAINVLDTNTRLTRSLAPLPEPATWAMMLLGIAAIGAAMRRSRRRVGLLQLA